jgi:hypothetical protein
LRQQSVLLVPTQKLVKRNEKNWVEHGGKESSAMPEEPEFRIMRDNTDAESAIQRPSGDEKGADNLLCGTGRRRRGGRGRAAGILCGIGGPYHSFLRVEGVTSRIDGHVAAQCGDVPIGPCQIS